MDRRQKTVLLFLVSTFIMFMCPGETQASSGAGCCCPDSWTAYNGHCYRIFSNQKTWHQAEEFCNQFSVSVGLGETARVSLGHLVSINSPDENDFVVDHFETYFETTAIKDQSTGASQDLWIGCHDTTTEGTFKWSDESPFNFTMWWSNEPDNYDGDDCCEIKVAFNFDWNDDGCDDTAYFMCKMPTS